MSFVRSKGFTLIELMIVISIIAIIAAIAMPVIYETRTRAQIRATIGILRTITSGQQAYFAVAGNYTDLSTLSGQAYIDQRFAVEPAELNGYSIECDVTNNGLGFLVTATPSQPNAPTLTVDETFHIVEA